MDSSAINLSVTPLQALLALAFQAWLIVFPIILIRKVNRLEAIIEEHFGGHDDAAQETENV
ncbi:MAG: hypothetical protein HQL20_09700 [Candidatus Omnitrophica bacterium]|nr:hypothetical protein [Candidatus Omnitrophota bacterium]